VCCVSLAHKVEHGSWWIEYRAVHDVDAFYTSGVSPNIVDGKCR